MAEGTGADEWLGEWRGDWEDFGKDVVGMEIAKVRQSIEGFEFIPRVDPDG